MENEVLAVRDTRYQVPGYQPPIRKQDFLLEHEVLALRGTRYQLPSTRLSNRKQDFISENEVLALRSVRYQVPGTLRTSDFISQNEVLALPGTRYLVPGSRLSKHSQNILVQHLIWQLGPIVILMTNFDPETIKSQHIRRLESEKYHKN